MSDMKLIMESWEKYLAEAQLQKVDWSKRSTWPPGAREAYLKANALWKKWDVENERLQELFFDATLSVAKGEISDEEYARIADEHADHILKPLGDTTVGMLNVFHKAGFVPPKVVVQGANSWRSGELAKKKQADAELAALKSAGINTPAQLAAKIRDGEIEIEDFMKLYRALERKKAAQQNKG
jgi:hypothetical protein